MTKLQLAEELFLSVFAITVGYNILSFFAGRVHLSFFRFADLVLLLRYNKILDLGEIDPFLDTEG